MSQTFLENLPQLDDSSLIYFTEEMRPFLIEYIESSLETAKLGPRDSNRKGLQRKKTEAYGKFLEKTTETPVVAFTNNIPSIFSILDKRISEEAWSCKLKYVQASFPACQIDISENTKLSQKYMEALNLSTALDSINQQIDYITSKEAYFQVRLLPQSTSQSIFETRFSIIAKSDIESYSVHQLFQSSGLRYLDQPYFGELEYEFSYKELCQLATALKKITDWHKKFEIIFTDFLGADSKPYIKTGQKSLRHILEIEKERKDKKLPPFIKYNVIARLKKMDPNIMVFIPTQCAINLETHPDREVLKGFIEDIYRQRNLQNCNGNNKKFISDTHTSILSFEQIQVIFSEMMAVMSFSNTIIESGYLSVASYLNDFQLTIRESYHAYLIQQLKTLFPTQQHELFISPTKTETLESIKNRFNYMIETFMSTSYIPLLKKIPETVEPTDNEIRGALLPPERGQSSMFPDNPMYPATRGEVEFLCGVLRTCPGQQRSHHTFDNHINRLEKLLKDRFRKAEEELLNENYGKTPLQYALIELMRLATKLYFQEQMGISSASIDSMCIAIITKIDIPTTTTTARADSDHCTGGLAGRIADLNQEVTIQTDDLFLQADIATRKAAADDTFNEAIRGNTQSSHYPMYKKNIYRTLMLPTDELYIEVPRHISTGFFNNFPLRYTAGAIYTKCFETIIENIKTLIRENDDVELYNMLKKFGFLENNQGQISPEEKSELDNKFRINGLSENPWNLVKFELNLPLIIIKALQENRILKSFDEQGLVYPNGFINCAQPEPRSINYQSLLHSSTKSHITAPDCRQGYGLVKTDSQPFSTESANKALEREVLRITVEEKTTLTKLIAALETCIIHKKKETLRAEKDFSSLKSSIDKIPESSHSLTTSQLQMQTKILTAETALKKTQTALTKTETDLCEARTKLIVLQNNTPSKKMVEKRVQAEIEKITAAERERERAEAERIAERIRAERERAERERAEAQRIRLEREWERARIRAERIRAERERAEAQRLAERIRAERERAEAERVRAANAILQSIKTLIITWINTETIRLNQCFPGKARTQRVTALYELNQIINALQFSSAELHTTPNNFVQNTITHWEGLRSENDRKTNKEKIDKPRFPFFSSSTTSRKNLDNLKSQVTVFSL